MQLVTLRLRLSAPAPDLDAPRTPRTDAAPQDIEIIVDGVRTAAVSVHRGALSEGETVAGPAIVIDSSATTLVPPRWKASIDAWDNLVLERSAR